MRIKITEIDFSKFQDGEMQLRIKDNDDQEWLRGKIRKLVATTQTRTYKSSLFDNRSGSLIRFKIDLVWLAKEYTVTKILSEGPINVSRHKLIAKPYRREPGEPTLFSKMLNLLMFFRYNMEVDTLDNDVEIRTDGAIMFESTLGESCILLPSSHPNKLDEDLLRDS